MLSNESNTKINTTTDSMSVKQKNEGGGNYLPREFLEFLNFDIKLIADIMELQE